MSVGWIAADWPAPDNILAGTTTRSGGVSKGPYQSLNLGDHVGDESGAVAENRRRVAGFLGIVEEPLWLAQVHGADVADAATAGATPSADASVTSGAARALTIMTADCLPVLLCSRDGLHIAAAHGGWRSLAGGILENTVNAMPAEAAEIVAWLGPAISAPAFEVGSEVRDAFLSADRSLAACFEANARGRWQADLYAIATRQLRACGVADVYGGGFCTHADEKRFFSYRRDRGGGRMASYVMRLG